MYSVIDLVGGDASVSRRRTFVLATAAILAGAGCQATTMSAASARVPILVGPVACIGCGATPVPPPAGPAPLVDSSSYRLMASPYSWATTRVRPMIGRKTQDLPADSCRVNVQVSGLRATARGVWALFFAMTWVEVEVQAVPMIVPGASCYVPTRATTPSAAPTPRPNPEAGP